MHKLVLLSPLQAILSPHPSILQRSYKDCMIYVCIYVSTHDLLLKSQFTQCNQPLICKFPAHATYAQNGLKITGVN